MALQFVLGPAGSGKTKYLYDYVLGEAKKHPERTYYYIVPEQFSMITQWDLLSRPDCKGIMNIDVTSLKRLSDKAFGTLSGLAPEFLPEIAKSMIIKKVLIEKKDDLVLYRRNAVYPGFVAEAKALISELLQYSVSEEMLQNAIEQGENTGRLKGKLKDALTLLSGVESYLGEKKVTQEGRYDRFAELAEKSGVFSNSVVILDGFTGFTPSQREILKKILKLTVDVKCAITIDEASYKKALKPYQLFNMSKEAIAELSALADAMKIDVIEPVFTSYDKYADPSLACLKNGLYAPKKATCDTGAVFTFQAGDVKSEAKYAAIRIEKLLREEHYRLSDIAVLVSDLDTMGTEVYEALAGISGNVFLDRKRSLYENECAGFVMQLLRLMERGADTDNIIAIAKNSLSGIEHEEACLLETYCTALGIKGSRLERPFTKEYYGKMEISLDRVNGTREKLWKAVRRLSGLKPQKAADFARLLTATLEALKVEERLLDKADILKEKGESLNAQVYEKVYSEIGEILNQMVAFLGDEVISAQEFRGICEAGLMEAKVGMVPKGAEQIIIGDMERTRLKDVKALFILGANEGMLPKPAVKRPILTDKDKQTLEGFGITLSPDSMKKIGNDRFYTYLALTKPRERLYISWSGRDKEGTTLQVSQVVREVQSIFPNLQTLGWENLPEDERTLQNDLGKGYMLSEKRRVNAEKMALSAVEPERLARETAKALYGEKLYGSVSRLEAFAACPFKHFLKYGMRLLQSEKYELSPIDFGDVAHSALENYGKELKKRNLRWAEVEPGVRDEIITDCARTATDSYKEGIFKDSEKNSYIEERVEEALRVTVEMMTEQLKDTLFEPAVFEKPFKVSAEGYEFVGKIDRIDDCEIDGKRAVKIVDYKSSEHEVDLEELYYGNSLQLPLYMSVEVAESENAIPAALLYNAINDPILNLTDKAEHDDMTETIAKERTSQFKPQGLINVRDDVLIALDSTFDNGSGMVKPGVKSDKIGISVTKDGNIGKSKQAATDDEFYTILEFARKKVDMQSRDITDGNIAKQPIGKGKGMSCDRCDFHSVCGFDLACGDSYRVMKKLSKDEAIARMRKEEK